MTVRSPRPGLERLDHPMVFGDIFFVDRHRLRDGGVVVPLQIGQMILQQFEYVGVFGPMKPRLKNQTLNQIT